MFPLELIRDAQSLLRDLEARGLKLATAESCTGGLIAGCLTEVPGSSAVVERGFVTYSNLAKTEQLGVPAALIERHGAVSAQVAKAMATGALTSSQADITVAVTGVAGPGGGTPAKPVGLVYIGTASRRGEPNVQRFEYGDLGRQGIRLAAVKSAFELVRAAIEPKQ